MKTLIQFLFCLYISYCEEFKGCFVSLEPKYNIGLPGTSFHYICSAYIGPRPSSVKWYLDGILYNQTDGDVNMTELVAGAYLLRIAHASVEFNNTNIICSATINDRVCNSTASVLLIQGHPGQVEKVAAQLNFNCIDNGLLRVNWSESATLDISFNDNDVQYQIDIADMFGNTISDNVIESVYEGTLPDSNPENASCSSIQIKVTPFNDYSNGNSTTTSITPNEGNPVMIVNANGKYTDDDEIVYTFDVFPAVCDAVVTLQDIYDDTEINISASDVNIRSYCYNTSKIEIELNTTIPRRRHYNTIFHFPVNEVNTSIIISTFDVQQLLYFEDSNVLMVNFLENTTAMGALIILRSSQTCPVFIILNIYDAKNYQLSEDMFGRTVYVYDIEENGYLSEGISYPATEPKLITGETSSLENSFKNDLCSLNITNTSDLYVYCHCDLIELSDELQAIIFQNDDELGILHSQVGKCFEYIHIALNFSGLYNIAVFGVNKSRGITENSMYYTGNFTLEEINNKTTYMVTTPHQILTTDKTFLIGIIIGVTLFIFFITAFAASLISVLFVRMKRKRKNTEITESTTTSTQFLAESAQYSKMDEDSVSINYVTYGDHNHP